jgi:uncharacterized protein (DUF58 family)
MENFFSAIPVFFSRRFYVAACVLLALCIIAYFYSPLLIVVKFLMLALVVLALVDTIVLFSNKRGVIGKRSLAARFSNGDENKVLITLQNNYPFILQAKIVDELPPQFQLRDWEKNVKLKGNEKVNIPFLLRPVERGEYDFGKLNVFVHSPLGLVTRRFIFDEETTVIVYPSFMQMRKFQLLGVANQMSEKGEHRLRKIGASSEFEQIKEYVRGDDYRTVNWKATARKNSLMVNTFVDERSQSIICMIDKGRNMRSPFNGMTLMDYAINASLVLSNVALQKQDKAGIITFAEKIGNYIPPDKKGMQMENILELLYKQKTQYFESDFEALYAHVRTRVKQRSLMVLFTNFESIHSMYRQLPYLRQIAKHHLLLVVFFDNTELKSLRENKAEDIESIYIKTIADKFAYEKRMVVKELQKHGIISVLTTPEHLTVNTVNKYLELKARQAI